MNFTRYRVLTQVLLASEVHLDLVEMNFTRYRVLTLYLRPIETALEFL